jgi:hypothetical protein
MKKLIVSLTALSMSVAWADQAFANVDCTRLSRQLQRDVRDSTRAAQDLLRSTQTLDQLSSVLDATAQAVQAPAGPVDTSQARRTIDELLRKLPPVASTVRPLAAKLRELKDVAKDDPAAAREGASRVIGELQSLSSAIQRNQDLASQLFNQVSSLSGGSTGNAAALRDQINRAIYQTHSVTNPLNQLQATDDLGYLAADLVSQCSPGTHYPCEQIRNDIRNSADTAARIGSDLVRTSRDLNREISQASQLASQLRDGNGGANTSQVVPIAQDVLNHANVCMYWLNEAIRVTREATSMSDPSQLFEALRMAGSYAENVWQVGTDGTQSNLSRLQSALNGVTGGTNPNSHLARDFNRSARQMRDLRRSVENLSRALVEGSYAGLTNLERALDAHRYQRCEAVRDFR